MSELLSTPYAKALRALAIGMVAADEGQVPPFEKGGLGGIFSVVGHAHAAKSPPTPLWERGEA